MHEQSLVSSLLKQVDQLLDEHAADRVTVIEVQNGPLAGVESELVRIAFDRLAPQSRSSTAELRIQQSPLTVRCRECGRESDLNKLVFCCQHCGSRQVQVTRGDEFRLLSITVEQEVNA